jgi:hypothetical protein
MNHNVEQQIRERAYELWTRSGYAQGHDKEHWLEAERQLLAAQVLLAERQIPAAAARKVTKLRTRGARQSATKMQ